MKLDYTLRDYNDRKRVVEDVLRSSHSTSSQYLEHMADYLLFTGDKGSTKTERVSEYPLVTKNREVTVSKRQVSYEELVDSASENGGDCDFLNASAVSDKNRIMDHKDAITDDDLEQVPGLRKNAEIIESLKRQFNEAEGQKKYSLKKQIIDQYREQYVLRDSFRGGAGPKVVAVETFKSMTLPDEDIYVDEFGYPHAEGSASLLNPAFVSVLLRNYEDLKKESCADLESDVSLILMDLDRIMEKALRIEYPLYWLVLMLKIHKFPNEDVVQAVLEEFHVRHSEQYFSNIWNRKIPGLIAKQAQKEWILRHHDEIGFSEWKICSRCGQRKLKHPMFFSPNLSSADGYYTICKRCRRKSGGNNV